MANEKESLARKVTRLGQRGERVAATADDLDHLTESRPGIAMPLPEDFRYTLWANWRDAARNSQSYEAVMKNNLGGLANVKKAPFGIRFTGKEVKISDYGDKSIAENGGSAQEIELLIAIAHVKNWKTVVLTGGDEFLRAAIPPFTAAGISVQETYGVRKTKAVLCALSQEAAAEATAADRRLSP